MDRRAIFRYLIGPVPAAALSFVLLTVLFMLSAAAQHSQVFGTWFSVLLALSVLGIVAMAVLVALNVYRMMRQMRAGVLGSRLTLRLIGIFVLLAMIPLGVVYYISVQFLHRGIDSWFDVRIEQALDDALLLGRTSLEAIKEERVKRVQDLAEDLDLVSSREAMVRALDDLREQGGFTEMTLLSQDGHILATSNLYSDRLIPDRPAEAVLSKLRNGEVYANLEPTGDAGLELRIVVPVYPLDVNQPLRVLQVLEPLPLRYGKLGDSVQNAFIEYEKLVYLRGPLKVSFVLTLTLVALITLLIAVWAAIWSARRMTAPLRDLAEGTRAVARGDYEKQLPVSSGDELGVLVQSFNDMTRRIRQAQNAARRSQREAEEQRTSLETVLAHLSSGVFSFDARGHLRTLNASAEQILGESLARKSGEAVDDLIAHYPRLEPFFSVIRDAVAVGAPDWQTQVSLFGTRGRQIVISRGTRIKGGRNRPGGYVVVFDDVTALIQAQRDAAWGEVARRLAHEIKNPLTPIQLSAERIRHKYMKALPEDQREGLDRATRTIAEQVESMKSMVNSFSNYAQPKQMQTEPVNLNQLVQDVVELHRERDSIIRMHLELEPTLPQIMADRGRLRQVLNNLLINSLDALAGSSQPQVTIRTGCRGEPDCPMVELTVSDNGPGFPEDLLDRLFEPYVTTKEKGNGLGLAIVKRIVEEHGGALWAENLPGGGACLTIQLPSQATRTDNSKSGSEISARDQHKKERIA